MMIINRRSLVGQKRSKIVEMQEKKDVKDLPKSLDELRIGSPRNRSESRLERFSSPRENNGPINREVYLYSFSDEFQTLYKNLEDCIPDLEANWARRLKKGSRREEVVMRIPEIALSSIKQMPHIKESLDNYFNLYNAAFQPKEKPHKKTLKTESIELEKSESEGLMIKKRRKRKVKKTTVETDLNLT